MVHSFDVEHAKEYGIAPAILIHHLQFWIAHNRANKQHYHDGRTWTFNSVKAFEELFPYLSKDQVRRALDHLRDRKVIVVGNYNTTPYDRTAWYAFSDESKFLPSQIDLADLPNENGSDAKSLKGADGSTGVATDKTPYSPPKENGLFDRFWKAYPRKVGKDNARRAFAKRKVDAALLRTMLDAIATWAESDQWTKEGGKYIPYPATWLNRAGWKDELPAGSDSYYDEETGEWHVPFRGCPQNVLDAMDEMWPETKDVWLDKPPHEP